MRVLIIIQGDYGQRMVDNIKVHAPTMVIDPEFNDTLMHRAGLGIK